MTTEKQYLLEIAAQHVAGLNTSDAAWRRSHEQHLERIIARLKRECEEEA